MSNCIGHEACPKCGSRDNLARYADGGAWCFGCGYWERSDTFLQVSRRVVPSNQGPLGTVTLPDDLTTIMPPAPLEWLYSYGLTLEEIEYAEYYWSNSSHSLVSVFRDLDGSCIGTQSRGFPKSTPKYKILGDKLQMSRSMLRNRDSSLPLYFCEDQVSAIILNRRVPCVALFGTQVSLELIKWGSKTFSSFRLWLDPDKRKESVKQCLKLREKGFNISPVFSDLDPKELDDGRIHYYTNTV